MLLSDDQLQLVPLDESFVDFLTCIRTDWSNYGFFFDFHLATREQDSPGLVALAHDPARPTLYRGRRAGTGTGRHDRSHRALTAESYRGIRAALCGSLTAAVPDVARRASHLVLDYAFRVIELRVSTSAFFTDNERAIRLYHQLGFEHEGCMRGHIFKNGRYEDVTLMAIFAPRLDR